jgi:hypothetical protein
LEALPGVAAMRSEDAGSSDTPEAEVAIAKGASPPGKDCLLLVAASCRDRPAPPSAEAVPPVEASARKAAAAISSALGGVDVAVSATGPAGWCARDDGASGISPGAACTAIAAGVRFADASAACLAVRPVAAAPVSGAALMEAAALCGPAGTAATFCAANGAAR